jgi:hypothetical protein
MSYVVAQEERINVIETEVAGDIVVAVEKQVEIIEIETPALGISNKQIDDRVAALLQAGTGVSVDYNDTGNLIAIAVRNNQINVCDPAYAGGAKGDVRRLTNVSATSGSAVITSGSYSFTAADIGKTVFLNAAGTAGATLSTTIASVSSGAATLAAASQATLSGNGVCTFGTDDTAAFNAAFAAVRNAFLQVHPNAGWAPKLVIPPRAYLITDTINATGIRAHVWSVEANGAVLLAFVNDKPVIDVIHSRYYKFDGLTIAGDQNIKPKFGIMGGRRFNGTASDAGEFILEGRASAVR